MYILGKFLSCTKKDTCRYFPLCFLYLYIEYNFVSTILREIFYHSNNKRKVVHWIAKNTLIHLNFGPIAQCSEWVCKPNFFWDGFFDFNVSFWMCIMRIYSLKLPICHENIVKMVLNPVHLEHFSKNCLTLWVFTTVTCNFLVQ